MGSRTLDVVDQMWSRLPWGTQSTTETSLPFHEDVMFANDGIQDLVETLRNFRIPDPVEVKTALSRFDDTMLQDSLPFTEMKEDLRRFVFPSMRSYIRDTIFPLLPPTNQEPISSVVVRVHWEVEDYLDKEFDGEDDIGNIMTVTGDVACAQALPCSEYMQQSWPRTGAAMLAAVKHFLSEGYSSEYPRSFSSAIQFQGDKSVSLWFFTDRS